MNVGVKKSNGLNLFWHKTIYSRSLKENKL